MGISSHLIPKKYISVSSQTESIHTISVYNTFHLQDLEAG